MNASELETYRQRLQERSRRSASGAWQESETGTEQPVYAPSTDLARHSPPGAAEVQGEKKSVGEKAAAETILVVDDVDGVRELVSEVLEMQGYEVLVASNGRHALEVAESHQGPIHLLLTDVVMPRMGGKELADTLSERRPETKIVFMSGYSDEAIARQGVLREGSAFIKKPFTAETLTRRIRRELEA